MKIIYTIEDISVKGGAEKIITQKANSLATEYGHDVLIVSIFQDERPVSYPLAKGVRLISLNIPFVAKNSNAICKNINRIRMLLCLIKRFQKVADAEQPDIIFFTLGLGALLLPFCHTQAKKVYESHLARQFTPYHRLFYPMERCADTIVCLTHGDAQNYKRAKHVCVIPNFIEQPKHSVADYSCKKAIAVGRLEDQKGFDILIDCWRRVAEQHPDWHLDIYGEGPHHDKLQEQIDLLRLNDHITLCGRSNSIMYVYPEYSLHIMSSRYEGQPMTLIEAQACGLASVVFDFKFGASDIVRNGHNGIIVPQGDNKAFCEALCSMMNSEDKRKEYGHNALEMGKQYFKNNVFSKWIEFINNL